MFSVLQGAVKEVDNESREKIRKTSTFVVETFPCTELLIK